ncbi:MAG: hypothetical protein RIS70_2302 [Planctomycetota bacterium]
MLLPAAAIRLSITADLAAQLGHEIGGKAAHEEAQDRRDRDQGSFRRIGGWRRKLGCVRFRGGKRLARITGSGLRGNAGGCDHGESVGRSNGRDERGGNVCLRNSTTNFALCRKFF